jgi:hypothetical protein
MRTRTAAKREARIITEALERDLRLERASVAALRARVAELEAADAARCTKSSDVSNERRQTEIINEMQLTIERLRADANAKSTEAATKHVMMETCVVELRATVREARATMTCTAACRAVRDELAEANDHIAILMAEQADLEELHEQLFEQFDEQLDEAHGAIDQLVAPPDV